MPRTVKFRTVSVGYPESWRSTLDVFTENLLGEHPSFSAYVRAHVEERVIAAFGRLPLPTPPPEIPDADG